MATRVNIRDSQRYQTQLRALDLEPNLVRPDARDFRQRSALTIQHGVSAENRLDQWVGPLLRNLELPAASGRKTSSWPATSAARSEAVRPVGEELAPPQPPPYAFGKRRGILPDSA